MHQPIQNILIVGGGIGGLTAAIALQKAGFTCSVYERKASLSEVGAGITLWENALRVYDHLGIRLQLMGHGIPINGGAIGTSDGNFLSQMRLEDIKSKGIYMNMLGIHRALLQEALFEVLPAETVHFDHCVQELKETSDSIQIRFSNGKTATGDLVIGADGIHSTVREYIVGKEAPRYSGYTCWRGVTSQFSGWNRATGEFWGRGRRFGLIPIDKDRLYWFAVNNSPPQTQGTPEGNKAKLLDMFRLWKHQIPEVIEHTPDDSIIQNDIIDRPPTKGWSKGRATLLGDAIHSTTPNLGQGACMAIESAQVLTNLLSRHKVLPIALRSYEELRYLRTAQVTNRSFWFGKIAQLENPLACYLRNTVMQYLPNFLQVKQIEGLIQYDATSIGLTDL